MTDEEELRAMYLPVALAHLSPGMRVVADAMVAANIITKQEHDVLLREVALPEARRLQERDRKIQARRDRRRGIARLLNIGG